MRRVIAILLLFTTLSLTAEEKKEDLKPVPYEIDEFHPILRDIRRSSIIFCGAFPLGFMYTSIATDSLLSESDFYTDKTEQEQIEFKLLTSLAFAGVVMLIDFVIEKIIRGRE